MNIPTEEFHEAVKDLFDEMSYAAIWDVPGVQEIFIEYLNNAAIDRVKENRAEKAIALDTKEYWETLARARLVFGETGDCPWCDNSGNIQKEPIKGEGIEGYICPVCW